MAFPGPEALDIDSDLRILIVDTLAEGAMDGIVRKWGNSLALRLPNALAKDVGLRQGTEVSVTAVKGRLVIKARKTRRVGLTTLLKGVTAANLPERVDWGRPMGKETW